MQTYSQIEIDNLAVAFVREFARLESALVNAGCHHGNGDARPNWDEFVRSPQVASYFSKQYSGELGAAIRYLVEQPPKTHVVIDNELRWKTRRANGSVSNQLCKYVRSIRNNLFHADEFNQDWLDLQRREQLMQYGLRILQAFLDASPEVATAYDTSRDRELPKE